MDEEIVELLKSINNGKLKGAKKKLAEKLNISDVVVGYFCNKKREPSVDMLPRLAKVFNRDEKELKKIFSIKNNSDNVNSFNNYTLEELRNYKERIKLLEEKIAFLEEKIKFYKERKK